MLGIRQEQLTVGTTHKSGYLQTEFIRIYTYNCRPKLLTTVKSSVYLGQGV